MWGCNGLSSQDIANALQLEFSSYKNWRFSAQTVDLSEQALAITLKGGTLLGVEYICEPNTSPLFIGAKGQTFAVSTMKFGVQDGTYKFLVSYLPTEFLFPYPRPGLIKVNIRSRLLVQDHINMSILRGMELRCG